MPFRIIGRTWTQQPSGLVLPDLEASFVPEVVWLPQYTNRLWQRDNAADSSTGLTFTETASPILLAGPEGFVYSNAALTANVTWTRKTRAIQFPCAIGAVFVPLNRAASGVAWGSGSDTGTAITAARFEIGTHAASGNVLCVSRMAVTGGTTNTWDTGIAAALGEVVAVAFVERSATDRVAYINGRRVADTTAGSTPANNWNFYGAQTRKMGTAALAQQFPGYTLMGWSHQSLDPGDAWMERWTLDPWSMPEPQRVRVFIGNVYAVSAAESVTATDSQAALMAVAAAAAESATAVDAIAAALQAAAAISEAASAADSASAGAATYSVSAAETASAADAPAAAAVFPGAVVEAATAADVAAALAVLQASVTEAASASDLVAGLLIATAAVAEAAAASDSTSTGPQYAVSLTEAATASDAMQAAAQLVAAVTEAATAGAAFSAAASLVGLITEPATASDSASAGATTYSVSLSELAAALDVITATIVSGGPEVYAAISTLRRQMFGPGTTTRPAQRTSTRRPPQ